MMDVLSQTTIAEVILLFILVFLLPMTALMLRRLRKYEALARHGGEPRFEPAQPVPTPKARVKSNDDEIVPDVYPYQATPFLSPADRACLQAMREVLGPDVEVFPKVALWSLVESTDKAAGFVKRLNGLDYDFLVCDNRTGQPLTAVVYTPGKGRPAGRTDEIRRISDAAGMNVVFIDMAEEYDPQSMKEALGIPELDV